MGPLLLAFTFVVFATIHGVSEATESTEDQRLRNLVDSFVRNLMRCRDIRSLTLSLVRADHVVMTAEYGTNGRHLFPVGSLTKAFTSTLVAMYVNGGQGGRARFNFTWDSKVSEILRDVEFFNDLLTAEVSVKDLLAHRTGIPDYFIPLISARDISKEELMASIKYYEPVENFRDSFLYNNMLYSLIGLILEKVSGKTFEQLIQEDIFQPLSMNSSTTIKWDSKLDDVAPGWVSDEQGLISMVDNDALKQVILAAPAGSVLSAGPDMARWMMFHLRDVNNHVDVDELRETYEPVVTLSKQLNKHDVMLPDFPVTSLTMDYAFGWTNRIHRGRRVRFHSGSLVSYKSLLLLGSNFGAFVSMSVPNSEVGSLSVTALTHFLSDILLGFDPYLDHRTACTFPRPWQQPTPPPPPPNSFNSSTHQYPRGLNDLTGTYRHPGFGSIVVAKNMTMEYGRLWRAELLHVRGDEFLARSIGPLQHLTPYVHVYFTLESGRAPMLQLMVQFREIHFRRDEHWRQGEPQPRKRKNDVCACRSARTCAASFLILTAVTTVSSLLG